MTRRLLLLALLLVPTGCIRVPELDRAVPDWVEASDYPELIPLEGLGTTTLPGNEAERLENELAARQARLKRKAAALQEPVIDAETRARLEHTPPE